MSASSDRIRERLYVFRELLSKNDMLDIAAMLNELAEANAALVAATSDVEATNLEWEKRYVQRGRELTTTQAKLAEEQAALLHMEADRDGCLKIMFSSQHGKEIRELQIEVTRLRSQLERSLCGHLVAEWVEDKNSLSHLGKIYREQIAKGMLNEYQEDSLRKDNSFCAACKREADAVRRGQWQEHEVDCICCRYRAGNVPGDCGRCPRGAELFRALAPASQPTTEHVKEGDKWSVDDLRKLDTSDRGYVKKPHVSECTYSLAELAQAEAWARIQECEKIKSMLLPNSDAWLMVKGRLSELCASADTSFQPIPQAPQDEVKE